MMQDFKVCLFYDIAKWTVKLVWSLPALNVFDLLIRNIIASVQSFYLKMAEI